MDYKDVIGRKVHVIMDRPAGSYHPRNHDIYYPINYGYIEDVIAPDGSGQDVYVLGKEEPLETFDGIVIPPVEFLTCWRMMSASAIIIGI